MNLSGRFNFLNPIIPAEFRSQVFQRVLQFSRSLDWANSHYPNFDRPILLAGSSRGGTTLLSNIVGAHPNVLMFHEKFCVGKLSYRQTFESTNDPSALRRSFYQFLPHRAKTENTRWGVKILAHFWTQRDLDLFLQAFPRVEIVYVVRDGRDVLLSLMKRSKLLSTPEQCVNVWFRSIEVLDYLRSKMPDHLLWYYYEDLVTNPEAKVREICEFLGEPFRASMLDHRTWPGLGSYEISPILTDKVGKWKEQKLPDLPRELDERFRATLARMGYGDEPARVGADQPR